MNDVFMMSAQQRLERGDAGKRERYTSDKRDADTESLCNIEERGSGGSVQQRSGKEVKRTKSYDVE
jgi:hypothetical protein